MFCHENFWILSLIRQAKSGCVYLTSLLSFALRDIERVTSFLFDCVVLISSFCLHHYVHGNKQVVSTRVIFSSSAYVYASKATKTSSSTQSHQWLWRFAVYLFWWETVPADTEPRTSHHRSPGWEKCEQRKGHRQSDEHWNRFKGNTGGNFWEMRWSAYGLFRAYRHCLELNWTDGMGRIAYDLSERIDTVFNWTELTGWAGLRMTFPSV